MEPPKFEIPQTLSEALMLAAKQAKKVEELEYKVQDDAPKVEFANTVINTENVKNL